MKRRVLLICLFFFSSFRYTIAQLNPSESDHLALLEFATATHFAGWTVSTNWDFTTAVSDSWYGITITNGRVSKIELPNNNLVGTQANQLYFLSALGELTELDLSGNQIGGEIADELFFLTTVKILNLSSNSELTKADLATTKLGTTGFMTALQELNLSQTNISGNFPANLNNLAHLEVLDVSQCQMSGILPNSNLLTLTKLYKINLSHNQFIGNLPNDLSPLNKLIELDFSSNKLTGSIKNTLQNSINLILLERLNLSDNNFTGTLPDNLSHFSSLKNLDVSRNRLTGTISTIYPTHLTELYFQQNRFTALPNTFIGLNAIRIELNSNHFSGLIPKSLLEQSKLRALYLNDNQFIGNFPDITNGATANNLEELYLDNNQLNFISSDLPLDCPNLEVIRLQNNFLTTLPDFSSNTQLSILQVDNNQLTFHDLTLPSALPIDTDYDYSPQAKVLSHFTTIIDLGESVFLTSNLPSGLNQYKWLKDIDTNQVGTFITYSISGATNDDTGLYWAEITNPNFPDLTLQRQQILVKVENSTVNQADSLALVDIYNTCNGVNWKIKWTLTDEIRTWFGVTVDDNTNRVTKLELRDNNLSNPLLLPSSGSAFNKLQTLDLSNNKLSGSLSGNIGNLTTLQNLYLHENQFTGNLPNALGNLTNLQRLTLNDNQFTGNLPTILNNLTLLELLHLHNNLFIGTIPTISNLSVLREGYFHHNSLTGDVPDFSGFTLNLEKLRLQDNYFKNLPDLSSIPNLEILQVENNQFTFEDLQPNRLIANFSYVPQSDVLSAFTTILEHGGNVFFTAGIGGTGNDYQWYQDTKNTPVGTNTDTHTITGITAKDVGVYWAEITNPDLPFLTINRRLINAKLSDVTANLTDSLILIDLYLATRGENWTIPWITADPVQSWRGVGLDNQTGRVTKLELSNNNLDGTALPASLGNLNELTQLNLSNNKLTGFIPPQLGNLGKLENLLLHENSFVGTIPSELGLGAIKTNLVRFKLNDNQLSGSIPIELNQLSSLTLLHLNDNLLTGDLPDITPLTNLKELYVFNNQLTGAIPNFSVFAPDLEKLKIQNNLFDELPDLSALTYLTTLQVAYNRLTFSDIIPNTGFFLNHIEFSPQLETMNEFTTAIFFGQSTFLTADLSETGNIYKWYKDSETNQINTVIDLPLPSMTFDDAGVYWAEITNPSLPALRLRRKPINVRVIKVEANRTDSLALVALYHQTNGDKWTRSWRLDLEASKTKINRIPVQEWYGITLDETSGKVVEVSLSDNGLDGTLPETIGDLNLLRHLDLSNNFLAGNLPHRLGDLTALINCFLDENEFSGMIPSTMGNMTAIVRILLNDNELSGNIPKELGNLNFLALLHLYNNSLSGTIPAHLANAQALKQLYLYNNRLSGDFPVEFTSVTKLERLKLQLNHIQNLPDLSNIPTIGVLEVAENQLTFEDLQSNRSIFQTVNDYAPQQPVLNAYTKDVVFAESAGFDATVGGTNNQYKWLHNSIEKDNQAFLSISSAGFDDAGLYHAEITNADLPHLILERRAIVFNVFSTARAIKMDSLALVALYNTTNGQHWVNKWDLSQPVAQWYGITLDDNLGVVTEIRLPDNNLYGTIPSQIGSMSKLRALDLSNNYLKGKIPYEIGQLTKLVDLFLQENQLQNTLPSSLGFLSSATRIILNDNDFSGKIPSTLGKMSNLSTFHIFNNEFSGTLPQELGDLQNLKEFYLYNNLFEGVIPNSLGKLPRLERLKIQNNLFTHLPLFENRTLHKLELENNFFTFEDLTPNAFTSAYVYHPQATVLDTIRKGVFYGDTVEFSALIDTKLFNHYIWYKDTKENKLDFQPTIRLNGAKYEHAGIYWAEITNSILPRLTLIRNPIFFYVNPPGILESDSLILVQLFQENGGTNWQNTWNLEDPVNTWYGITTDLGRVIEINLAGNNLTGKLPKELGNLNELQKLNLNSNKIIGDIPTEIQFLTALTQLNLSFNNLENKIPKELTQLKNLTEIILNDNDFKGDIPQKISNLTQLHTLNLGNNKLSGEIPNSFERLSRLEALWLNGNLLEGKIPTELQELKNLEILNLSDNSLTGIIPSEVGNLPKIKNLQLGNNALTGTIPTTLSQLKNLVQLNLGNNKLIGNIPSILGQLSKLRVLNVEGNRLTGNIPDFSDLVKLRELALGNNQITGKVPSSLASLGDLRSLQLENNQLTDLPQLSENLQVLEVQNNRLTFIDLEANIFVEKLVYAPQAPLDTIDQIEVVWNQRLTLKLNDAGGAKTLYQWRRNNIPIGQPSENKDFTIENVDYSDAGEYTCDVTHAHFPELILSRRKITVTILVPEVALSDAHVLQKIYTENGGENWINQWDLDTIAIKDWYGVKVINDRVIELDLRNNRLTGKLLSDIKFLTELQVLRLSGNQLTGQIPPELSELSQLIELDLANNTLTGKIPNQLEKLTKLQKLYLQGNQFYQTKIPIELGYLPQIQEVDLSDNGLIGEIPESFQDSPNLTKLLLNNNNLRTVPNLAQAPKLAELQLAYNYLTFKNLAPNCLINTFRYAPQKNREGQVFTTSEGEDFTFFLSDSVLENNNQYQWFRKTDWLPNEQKSHYFIPVVETNDSDNYLCQVQNTLLPNLTLSYQFTLNVVPSTPSISIPKPYCVSDTLVTLISESHLTKWYADADLQTYLGKGEKLRLAIPETQKTVYAMIDAQGNQSQIVSAKIIRRPSISLINNILQTDKFNNLIYQWYKNGIKLTNQNQYQLEIRGKSARYKVTVVTNEGCSSTSMTYQLKNGRLEEIEENNQITGLEKTKLISGIYPNPYSQDIEVRFVRNHNYKVEAQITDTSGKVRFEKSLVSNSGFILHTPHLEAGIYLLTLTIENQKFTHKIIKK